MSVPRVWRLQVTNYRLEGRECARAVDTYLTGRTLLPSKGEGDLPKV